MTLGRLGLALLLLLGGSRGTQAATLSATPLTLSGINATARAGDTVTLSPGTYASVPAPSVDGVTYLGNPSAPLTVHLSGRLTFSKGRTVVRGVDAAAGVTFDVSATNDTLSDAHIGGDLLTREADGCVVLHSALDVWRVWYASQNESVQDTLRPASRVVGGGLQDCRVAIQGQGGNHLIRFAGTRGVVWRRVTLTGRTSTTTGNSALKLFDTQGARFEDCSLDVENACTSGCDESGNVVIRDRSLANTFLRTRIHLWGQRSDIWLTASGMAGNEGSNARTRIEDCTFINDTPGAIYWQNGATGDTLLRSTFRSRDAVSLHALGSTSWPNRTPVLIEGCLFENTAGGPAFLQGDGSPWVAAIAMRGNAFVATGVAPALKMAPDLVAGLLASDWNTLWSGGTAAGAVSFWRSCCGTVVGSVAQWTLATGYDAHSAFRAPDLLPPAAIRDLRAP